MLKIKKFLALGIIIGSFSSTFAQDFLVEKISGYARGVEDTLHFLEAEANVKIPPKGYWLWIDVSALPFWKRVAFANILKEKNGIYPAYLYNSLTYQALFVVETNNNMDLLIKDAKVYKNLYPTLKVYVSEVENPYVFRPIVRIGLCRIPKPRLSYDGIIQSIETAYELANGLGDSELANYLKKVKRNIEKYLEIKKLEGD